MISSLTRITENIPARIRRRRRSTGTETWFGHGIAVVTVINTLLQI
jgi:hypothetical protein